jgi:uncharacterized protein
MSSRWLHGLVLGFFIVGCQSARPSGGPNVWLIERGDARVYVFGFAGAQDRSWLSPTLESAFDASSDVWFEVPPPSVPGAISPVVQELGYDRSRSLFDVLEPDLARRTLEAATALGIARERLEPMRPWLAREVIQRAYQASGKAAAVEGEYADAVLRARALAAGKQVHHEFESVDDVIRLFATMSDAAQCEYLANMLDFIDAAKGAAQEEHYGWISGKPSIEWLDMMRTNSPALYDAMHPQRNVKWAEKIQQLLLTGGTHLIVVGLNHTLGPDSIQENAARQGMQVKLIR